METNLKQLSKQYFETFSNKDIDALSDMFSDDVSLRDWEIQASGKTAVVAANKNIFSTVETINVRPTHIYSENNTVIAELWIAVNDDTNLLVTDVIEFDDSGKITDIRAYKGN